MFLLSFIAVNVVAFTLFKFHETLLVTIQLNLFCVRPNEVGQIKCRQLLQIIEFENKPSVSYRYV
jgi:hypothetical protein